MGMEISEAYTGGVVLVAVLKGCLPFVADLVRAMTVVPLVDLMSISTYAPDSGRVRIQKDLDMDVTGLDVVLVEDIVDTGLTLSFLLTQMAQRGPRSVSVCTLLDRTARRIVPTPLRFRGFEVPDEFLVGYGLDYAERYRDLNFVASVDRASLIADPDALVPVLYPS